MNLRAARSQSSHASPASLGCQRTDGAAYNAVQWRPSTGTWRISSSSGGCRRTPSTATRAISPRWRRSPPGTGATSTRSGGPTSSGWCATAWPRAVRRARWGGWSPRCAATTALPTAVVPLAENPAADVAAPRAWKALPKFLTVDEVDALLQAPDLATPRGAARSRAARAALRHRAAGLGAAGAGAGARRPRGRAS